MTGFYDLKAKNGDGFLDFSLLKDKVVLIVNVASLCGFTPQYHELQKLYETFPREDFEILAFPCDQFGDQEFDDLIDIRKHVASNFKVSFPILSKVNVNGEQVDPIFTYLKERKRGFIGFKGVRWNFEKFLVNADGEVVGRYLSPVSPRLLEPLIREVIERKKRQQNKIKNDE